DGKQVVRDGEASAAPLAVEALVVQAHEVDEVGEGKARLVAQLGGGGDEILRGDLQRELAAIDRWPGDRLAQGGNERGLQAFQGVGHQRREMVWVRRIL